METIKYQGRIVKIGQDKVSVEITKFSACHNCDARHGCGLMECRNQTIDIETPEAASFQIGETVDVNIMPSAGLWAVFYSYGLPLILMLITLITANIMGYSELISGISGIIVLIPYYFWLFLNQKRFKKRFNFRISKP